MQTGSERSVLLSRKAVTYGFVDGDLYTIYVGGKLISPNLTAITATDSGIPGDAHGTGDGSRILKNAAGSTTFVRKTTRLKVLEAMVALMQTEKKIDSYGNEYILISGAMPSFDGFSQEIIDKTQFEAITNHVHIIDKISKAEFKQIQSFAPTMCQLVLDLLCSRYPDKYFYVFASAVVHDSFILRFHQRWLNEMPYYESMSEQNEWVVFRSGSSKQRIQ